MSENMKKNFSSGISDSHCEKSNQASTICSVLMLSLLIAALLFTTGCAFTRTITRKNTTSTTDSDNASIKLYVDAAVLTEQDKDQQAIQKLNESVKMNNRFSLAYSLMGEIYYKMKDYENSAASYETATRLNRWSFKDFFDLGMVYQLMEEFAQAVNAYAKACELKPDHFQAHLNAAQSFYELKEYNEALAYGQRAEQIDPNISDAQKLLGDIYESQKDHDQAITSYKRALEIDSNNLDVMTSLGLSYLRATRYNSAVEVFKSMLQINPDSNTAYKYLASCYLGLTEIDKAITAAKKAIELDQNDWYSHKVLGVAFLLKGLDKENNDKEIKDKFKATAVDNLSLSLKLKADQPHAEKIVKLIQKYSK